MARSVVCGRARQRKALPLPSRCQSHGIRKCGSNPNLDALTGAQPIYAAARRPALGFAGVRRYGRGLRRGAAATSASGESMRHGDDIFPADQTVGLRAAGRTGRNNWKQSRFARSAIASLAPWPAMASRQRQCDGAATVAPCSSGRAEMAGICAVSGVLGRVERRAEPPAAVWRGSGAFATKKTFRIPAAPRAHLRGASGKVQPFMNTTGPACGSSSHCPVNGHPGNVEYSSAVDKTSRGPRSGVVMRSVKRVSPFLSQVADA